MSDEKAEESSCVSVKLVEPSRSGKVRGLHNHQSGGQVPRVINVTYHQYIGSQAWRRKRKERLEIDDYRCARCKDNSAWLEVHHLTYDRLGSERMEDLITLCRDCHMRDHGKDPTLPPAATGRWDIPDRVLERWSLENWQQAVADMDEILSLVAGFCGQHGIRLNDPRVKGIKGNLDALMRETAYYSNQTWEAAA